MIILIAPSAIGRVQTIERSQHPVPGRIGFCYIYNLSDQSTNAALRPTISGRESVLRLPGPRARDTSEREVVRGSGQ